MPRRVSYLLNLEAASEVGIDPEEVRGVLATIAPMVGTALSPPPRARSSMRSTSRSMSQMLLL